MPVSHFYLGQRSGDTPPTPTPVEIVVDIAPSGSTEIVLADFNEFNKVELEYAFSIIEEDALQYGRITLLYDGVSCFFTSFEAEFSPNKNQPDLVDLIPFVDGNNIGIRVDNDYPHTFQFKYLINNKFLIPIN